MAPVLATLPVSTVGDACSSELHGVLSKPRSEHEGRWLAALDFAQGIGRGKETCDPEKVEAKSFGFEPRPDMKGQSRESSGPTVYSEV